MVHSRPYILNIMLLGTGTTFSLVASQAGDYRIYRKAD